ncbi:hypothetical protein WAI453_001458 [Rhynchosporium graminicola]
MIYVPSGTITRSSAKVLLQQQAASTDYANIIINTATSQTVTTIRRRQPSSHSRDKLVPRHTPAIKAPLKRRRRQIHLLLLEPQHPP